MNLTGIIFNILRQPALVRADTNQGGGDKPRCENCKGTTQILPKPTSE